jgi:hypothetical protein
MPQLALYAIGALSAAGAFTALGHFLASRLRPANFHTGHEKLDQALDIMANAVESVLKSELNGSILDQLAMALAGGKPLAGPLLAELPRLEKLVLDNLGPALQATLNEALGQPDAAQKRVTTELRAQARDLTIAHMQYSPKLSLSTSSGTRELA